MGAADSHARHPTRMISILSKKRSPSPGRCWRVEARTREMLVQLIGRAPGAVTARHACDFSSIVANAQRPPVGTDTLGTAGPPMDLEQPFSLRKIREGEFEDATRLHTEVARMVEDLQSTV